MSFFTDFEADFVAVLRKYETAVHDDVQLVIAKVATALDAGAIKAKADAAAAIQRYAATLGAALAANPPAPPVEAAPAPSQTPNVT